MVYSENGKNLFRIIRSSRKTTAIQIVDGEVVVHCPFWMSDNDVRALVESRSAWIRKHLQKQSMLPPFTDGQMRELTGAAKEAIPQRVAYFAPLVGVTYGRITIRSQHSRWGSCSSRGNLNFNCLLMLVPARVLDYVVVHELCHRKEMNHSSRFWAEVERILPDCGESRKWLKENGPALIGRLP